MRLPTWDELIEEQLTVLEHPLDKDLFVVGPPGSGKTILAVHRAGAAAENGQVALVTFNRMLRRLAALLSASAAVPHTMNRFAYHDYRNRTGEAPPGFAGDTFDYDWAKMLATLDGHHNAGASWDQVVVDEGQDLPAGFFEYLRKHASVVLTVFADEDQALSNRRTTLSQIRASGQLPAPVLLTENHRNSSEIAALAEHFHSGVLPAATRRRGVLGSRPRLLQSLSADQIAEFIATWFENRGGTVGVVVARNNTGTALQTALASRLPEKRIDCYTSAARNEDAIALLAEGVTILNKESVKGQEFDTVFLLESECFLPCRTDVAKRLMYMLCSRARDHLFLHTVGGLSAAALAALPGLAILERG